MNINVSPQWDSQADFEKLNYTENDTKDMERLGNIPQLRRTFRKASTISLLCVLCSTWEVLFVANVQGLIDGGLAGLFCSYVWTMVGFGLIATSLAEMASIAPTDGGMYHWVSEFAPPKYEHFLSYLTGWLSTLAWQASNASGALIAGTVIQALVVFNDASYDPKAWQGTLLTFGAVLIVYIWNTVLINYLHILLDCMMVLHITAFVTVTIVLWVGPPHTSASNVFTTFSNYGGWSSTGLSLMIGQVSAIYAIAGSDAAAHMAEETRDAGLVVAQAMIWSFLISALTGLVFLITMLFTITSLEDALTDPTGYTGFWMLQQALPHSKAGITVIVAALLIFNIASNACITVSASRQAFAFARDRGLPFSSWISHVHPRLLIPLNSITITCVITCLLACINIFSSVAFNAVVSLFLVALMATYVISISCVLYRKFTTMTGSGDPSRAKARWLMPLKTGMVVNALSILYSVFAFFWCFWPYSTSRAASELNWAPVIFGAVMLVAPMVYLVQGRRKYVSPVSRVIHRGI